MTLKAKKFTPEVLLSAPRRSAGLPSADGKNVLYKVTTYSFENQSTKSELRLLDVSTKEDILVTDASFGEYVWLDQKTVVVLQSGEEGITKVLIGTADDFEKSHYTAGEIDASASALKVKQLPSGDYALAIAAQTTPDGSLYNEEKAPKPKTSGRLYTEIFVRHWDYWLTPHRNSIWYGKLKKDGGGKFKLTVLTNVLKGMKLECPTPPFGGGDDYALSAKGIVFVAKDPKVNYATHTKMDIYMLSITDFEDKPSGIEEIPTDPYNGLASSVVVSNDGTRAAFLKMKEDGYEADKNEVFVILDVTTGVATRMSTQVHAPGGLDRSPSSVVFSDNGQTLFLLAEDQGKVKLYMWELPGAGSTTSSFPLLPVEVPGSISDVKPLQNGRAFLSGNSLVDNSTYYILEQHHKTAQGQPSKISSTGHNGSLFGLSRDQVDNVWYDGAFPGQKIHAIMVKPSFFDPEKKYPLAYLIHGGPQGAWNDSWSTRWNPAIFAEQGYIVVCPNPTGSTGYGQALTNAIQGQWGGLPYQDLVKGFEYLGKEYPYIDTDRAVALGASYGGYMMNWIQGNDLGRKFKAIVCHDGVFSMAGQMASEELWFPFHDLKGPLWKNPEAWAQWDPSKLTGNWDTPQLIIHSELDYRLTVSEGLAAFNVLQARGVESQFLTFPDENHWVLKPENSLLWHKVVLDWINSHVGLPKYSDLVVAEANDGI